MVPSQVRPTAAIGATSLLQFQGGLAAMPSLYGVRSRYGHSCYPYLASATTRPLATEGGANLGGSSTYSVQFDLHLPFEPYSTTPYTGNIKIVVQLTVIARGLNNHLH